MNKKTIFKLIKEYFLIGLGTLILAIGLQFFFFPNKIASGGVTGLALVVNSIFGFSTGLFVAISNLILFTLAFIVISGQFGFKSIYATVLLSVFLSLFEKFYLFSYCIWKHYLCFGSNYHLLIRVFYWRYFNNC